LAQPASTGPVASDEEALLLLRRKGLSIKYMDEESKQLLRTFIKRWYIERGASHGDIAKIIGNKTSGYVSWLSRELGVHARDFEEARLKGIHEKVRKYERRPFDGIDADKAYLLGIRHGDLTASRPFGDAIRVSTSTTHPAMSQLFRNLFERYGHIYELPRFKKDTNNYEWNLQVVLDGSFEFLLQEFNQAREWLEESEERVLNYLSGLLDADGSILTTRDKYGNVYVFVDYFNSDKALLEWIKRRIDKMGYLTSLRLNKARGTATRKYNIVHRKDYLQLSIYGMDRIYNFLASIHPRHPEKILRQSIAADTFKGQSFASVEQQVRMLRDLIRVQTRAYVARAQEAYQATHRS
jgi:hypothetical protein